MLKHKIDTRSNSTAKSNGKSRSRQTHRSIREEKTADEFESIEGYTVLTDPDPTISSYCTSGNQIKTKDEIDIQRAKLNAAAALEFEEARLEQTYPDEAPGGIGLGVGLLVLRLRLLLLRLDGIHPYPPESADALDFRASTASHRFYPSSGVFMGRRAARRRGVREFHYESGYARTVGRRI